MKPNWIMIVDDEFDLVSLFKDALQSRGFEVFAFTEPVLALEHFTANNTSYSLAISDIRMPIMSGIELVKSVRQIDANISIILMSAFDVADSGISDVKINKFVGKPVMISDFISVVREEMKSFEGK